MHEDILKGKWKEIKGEVKKQWGELTDDDLMQIEGDQTKLLGFLQERYGYAHDEAEKEFKKFMERHKRAA